MIISLLALILSSGGLTLCLVDGDWRGALLMGLMMVLSSYYIGAHS